MKGKGLAEGYSKAHSSQWKIHDLRELMFRAQLVRAAKTTTVNPALIGTWGLSTSSAWTYWDLFLELDSAWKNDLRYDYGGGIPLLANFAVIAQEFVRWIQSV